MDVLFLSRLQFGLTIGFHFLFPSISIGLVWYLVVLEAIAWRRGDGETTALSRMVGRIFALTFIVGVATGIVMSFQFGTNWAGFARAVSDVFGTFLVSEVLFSFFLESSFLGLWMFGGKRVPPWVRWASILIVAIATTISGFWILTANSWLQTPTGFQMEAGRLRLTNFAAAVFNPSDWPRFKHTNNPSLVAGSFIVTGICAYALLRKKAGVKAKRLLAAALICGALFSIGAVYPTGHIQAVEVEEYQPVKLAAAEGLVTTQGNAPFTIFGIPQNGAPYVTARVQIPGLLSFLFDFQGKYVVKGLSDFPKEQLPPVVPLFSAFHLMIWLGSAFVALTVLCLVFLAIGKLFQWRFMLWLLVVAIPFPLICIQLGWMTTEIGRQPWLVWQVMKTADALSPSVAGGELLTSLILFGLAYIGLGTAYVWLLVRSIRRGPVVAEGR
jgi:cytochrome bd ubiquinol oxidase subunit I